MERKSKTTKDIMNACGHRNSERIKAFENFPSSMCPACLYEEMKSSVKDQAITDLKAEVENYFKTINRLKTAIGDAIVQMDEEPAKELLKQALKE